MFVDSLMDVDGRSVQVYTTSLGLLLVTLQVRVIVPPISIVVRSAVTWTSGVTGQERGKGRRFCKWGFV